ncbi:hypothetical protein [Microbacterium immunditiarum]|uniref:Uncharacterized protein n=1 Tax=Microbacterium immunditiarum TaxID=337480 RepID=A0A7Y9GPV2_9MICO|nr:hypothetical protein [Microbacterium immunditiarum]NYE20505.1 hypothetical protein [Microbacterium immunditiarum]
MTNPNTRAERRARLAAAGAIPDDASSLEQPITELVAASDPSILPLWARRIAYSVGALGGAAAIIVQGYDPTLGANIAGASAVLVSTLALANPTRL